MAKIKKSKKSISLVLPYHNEKESLIEAVDRSDKVLSSMFDRYEIILVNDASNDESAKVIKKIIQKYPSVKVIHNLINMGQGGSILVGFKKAQHELVVHNGIDSPFDLSDLNEILPHFPEFDIVVGTRKKSSGYGLWRRFVSTINRSLRYLFFRTPFKDLNFIQVYKNTVIKKINVKSRSPGFVTQELIIRAHKQGHNIKQVHLPYYPRQRSVSHHGKLRDIVWTFSDMVIFWFEQFNEKKQR